MVPLSDREQLVAEQYGKGMTDKEVAQVLGRSEWTIKAQKKDIYRKLGISKDTELVLFLLCQKLKKNFDLKEIRKHGLEFFFSILLLFVAMSDYQMTARQQRTIRTTRTIRTNRKYDVSA